MVFALFKSILHIKQVFSHIFSLCLLWSIQCSIHAVCSHARLGSIQWTIQGLVLLEQWDIFLLKLTQCVSWWALGLGAVGWWSWVWCGTFRGPAGSRRFLPGWDHREQGGVGDPVVEALQSLSISALLPNGILRSGTTRFPVHFGRQGSGHSHASSICILGRRLVGSEAKCARLPKAFCAKRLRGLGGGCQETIYRARHKTSGRHSCVPRRTLSSWCPRNVAGEMANRGLLLGDWWFGNARSHGACVQWGCSP